MCVMEKESPEQELSDRGLVRILKTATVFRMACSHVITGLKSKMPNKYGNYYLTYDESNSFGYEMTVRCGQCTACRLGNALQWAVRCSNEASLYDVNCFVTLTYAPEYLPENGSLRKSDFQKFMKRLRKEIEPKKLRYYMCGEYGDKLERPHYHVLLFGFEFEDKKFFKKTKKGDVLYRSAVLESLWPFGYSTIGELNLTTAKYIARYIIKKVNGDLAVEHYEKVMQETGEVIHLLPEYTNMSLNPGVGREWYEKNKETLFERDEIIIEGKKYLVPYWYEKIYRDENLEGYKAFKKKRVEKQKAYVAEKKNFVYEDKMDIAGQGRMPEQRL